MRIAALGGAGDMGSRAVVALAGETDVARVTILDRNLAAAESLARSLDASPAEVVALAVDADDHRALVQALRGHDLAVSALGPFHRFEEKLVGAALEAGVDYASICDEWEPAEQVFERFSERAREEGRVVVTGLGASPGLTNVGARLLAGRMDRVDSVEVSVYQPLDAGGGEAVIRHMLHIMSGHVAAWSDGRARQIRALSDARTVVFPRFGPIRLWNMGHSEPWTLPRTLSGLREASFHMGFGKGSRLLVVPARLGLFERRRIAEPTVRLLAWMERRSNASGPAQGAIRLDVRGEREGRPAHEMGCGVGEMREVTGLSLAVGALMVGRGQLTSEGGGVFAPEGCIDPEIFFHGLRDRGLAIYRDLAMSQPFDL